MRAVMNRKVTPETITANTLSGELMTRHTAKNAHLLPVFAQTGEIF